MATIIFLAVVAIAAIVAGVVVLRRARETVVPVGGAPPEFEVEGAVLRAAQHDTGAEHDAGAQDDAPDGDEAPVIVRWARRFESSAGSLDDAARLALIRDLGFVRGAWCIPLLAQAYEEEQGVEHQRAVLTALAAYRHPDARATFEQALRSEDESQRAIAETALAQVRSEA